MNEGTGGGESEETGHGEFEAVVFGLERAPTKLFQMAKKL